MKQTGKFHDVYSNKYIFFPIFLFNINIQSTESREIGMTLIKEITKKIV